MVIIITKNLATCYTYDYKTGKIYQKSDWELPWKYGNMMIATPYYYNDLEKIHHNYPDVFFSSISKIRVIKIPHLETNFASHSSSHRNRKKPDNNSISTEFTCQVLWIWTKKRRGDKMNWNIDLVHPRLDLVNLDLVKYSI